MFDKFFNKIWYQNYLLAYLLIPFSFLYFLIYKISCWYKKFKTKTFKVPVIVIGNITTGGTGKTPLVIAIAKQLTKDGYKVGIISRGYKSSLKKYPYRVKMDDDAAKVGDEPLLLVRNTKCPVVIAPDRNLAIEYLLTTENPDVILSDDGLQHYKMTRVMEIAVIDGDRGLGNGLLLPAGPLRETKKRLNTVDMVVVSGGDAQSLEYDKNTFNAQYVPGKITSLLHDTVHPIIVNTSVDAVSGIGNPDKFFRTLKNLGIKFTPQIFPDHHNYKLEELNQHKTIIMTEKDAVKCESFATPNMYYLPVSLKLSSQFWDEFNRILAQHK